ncbi:hypothetical protein KY331_01965 [Candidatus Woesearchaeota archaeon]|nr:hypothetical protein [Candidatus Woesearchaeota archaeon]
MTETIAILFIFFLLVLFGLMFYSRIQNASLEREQEEDKTLKSIQIAQKVSYFPEIQCTTQAELPSGCIDIEKLESYQEIINQEQNKLYYFQVFEYSKVYVEQVYPENKTWEIYDLRRPEYKGELKIPVPVALHEPIDDTFSFGVLNINVYI